MSLFIQLIVLIVVLVAVYFFYQVMKSIIPIIINSIAGLLVFLALNWFFGFGIEINFWSLLTVGLGGFFGLMIVLILHFIGIAF
ncbi:pro-sigmaK processing inhibitor BofA family protein [Candidatus Micrarchaeota archaeon]|nr:pro-sigmaK processing inhibitor BofA family protein [Candidatus Micrarchaeota archaeon]MBU1165794.1 pro-sigmaK processing inhibitor BofA family protein [Candidatus Micrarchaeota archaeon]MBU1886290.1 pro-sigmaK processing inhibitor BofA family protein [Candidatus Micrarchaeota archaeon]